jgi:hypothetical protein
MGGKLVFAGLRRALVGRRLAFTTDRDLIPGVGG